MQPSVAFWFDFNQNFVFLSNESNFRALALSLIELWPFSPHNLWKSDFFLFFRQSDPPRKSQNVKNAQFLQWILKDDDVYFQNITVS